MTCAWCGEPVRLVQAIVTKEVQFLAPDTRKWHTSHINYYHAEPCWRQDARDIEMERFYSRGD